MSAVLFALGVRIVRWKCGDALRLGMNSFFIRFDRHVTVYRLVDALRGVI